MRIAVKYEKGPFRTAKVIKKTSQKSDKLSEIVNFDQRINFGKVKGVRKAINTPILPLFMPFLKQKKRRQH